MKKSNSTLSRSEKARIRKENYDKIVYGVADKIGITLEDEYRFDYDRLFRFDYALVCCRLGIEIMGNEWAGGHTRGGVKDRERENCATIKGWRILKFSPSELDTTLFITLKTFVNYHHNHKE